MTSYVVTGASRGIGLEFVRQLSASPDNIVFALVRNMATAVAVPSSPLKSPPSNVHVLEADVTDYKALKAAARKVSEVTGGRLDVLINNAAAIHGKNHRRSLLDFEGEDELLEEEFEHSFKVNVIGVIHSTNTFFPLLRNGMTKKVITISSSAGTQEFVMGLGLGRSAVYGASKAAVNMVVSKFAIALQKDGIIIIALCPGLVNTITAAVVAEESKWIEEVTDHMVKTFPNTLGMITPDVSVQKQLGIIEGCTIHDTGKFFSIWGPLTSN